MLENRLEFKQFLFGLGVDPATGQDIYQSKDGRALLANEAAAEAGSLNNFLNQNLVPYGNPFPDFTGGFSSRFTYKNWYLNTLWSFSVGQDFIASGENVNSKYAFSSMDLTPLRNRLGRWRNPGDVTNVARLSTDPTIWTRTTEYVSDVDYLRMRDLTIGYRFDLEANSFIRGLELYAKFTNFLTITNAQPWMYDPENYVQSGNLNLLDKWKQVPQAKTVNVGVNLKF
jgi:hypothetical protein